MAIKERLKQRRLELNMTLEDVAKIVGITRQTVQKYESGVVSNIPSDKIEDLAKALKTTPAYIMGWEDNEESNATDDDIKFALFNSKDGITDEMLDEVKEFAKFVKSKYKK